MTTNEQMVNRFKVWYKATFNKSVNIYCDEMDEVIVDHLNAKQAALLCAFTAGVMWAGNSMQRLLNRV